jgi:hypothetical protein
MDFAKQIATQIAKKIFELPLNFLVPCFIILSLTISSSAFREATGMQTLYLEYQPWITLVCLYFGLNILCQIVCQFFKKWCVHRQRKPRRMEQETLKMQEIIGLPEEEQAIINQLLQPSMDRIWIAVDNPAAANLLRRKILTRITFGLQNEYQGLYRAPVPGYWYCLKPAIKRFFDPEVDLSNR